jgi:hypothetical protein
MQPSHRSTRTLLAALAALVAVLAASLLGAGCGSDDEADGDDGATTSSETTTPETVPPVTVSDADFEAVVTSLDALITSAAGDPCKLADAFGQAGSLPTPTNETQTRQGTEVVAQLFITAAATPPAGAEADATVLDRAGQDLLAEGEANGWDPDWLTGNGGPDAVNQADVQAAYRNYQTKVAEQCAPSAPVDPAAPSTTVP